MKRLVIAAAVVISGCTAQQLQYASQPIPLDDAKAITEQVLMEQPPKFRPQTVEFTNSYIAINNGVVSQGRGRGMAIPIGDVAVASGRSRSVSKELNSRIYYSSIGNTNLYTKGSWFIIQIYSLDRLLLQRVYCHNELNAHRFIDSINALKDSAEK